MAKAKLEGAQFSYEVAPDLIASASLEALFPGFDGFTESGKAAIMFALKTAARNATAGKMSTPEETKEAFEAVSTRLAAWNAGNWQAARAGGAAGESLASVLVRAISRALDLSPAEAQELITGAINEALEAAGLDDTSEDPEEKKKVRAVANAIRAELKKTVESTYNKVQEEDKAAKAASAKDDAEKLRAMLKR